MIRPLSLIALLFWSSAVSAGPVLDRVKAERMVHCGGALRPGLADLSQDKFVGLEVDICRAVASAVLGTPDLTTFSDYETPMQFGRVTRGLDDIFFLTGTEIQQNELAGKVVPGLPVFFETHNVMVPENSKATSLKDLAGDTICLMIGSRVERSVSAYFAEKSLPWQPFPFSEDGEMVDSYKAQRCHALAYELTSLAPLPLQPIADGRLSRILPDNTAVFPILAATSTHDSEWSAIVAWTVTTLISGERRETYWYAGGAGAMPVAAPELGLDKGWQARILAQIGDYGVIFDRHLGKNSALRLARGANANQTSGGLLLATFLE